MDDNILQGTGRDIISLPQDEFRQAIQRLPAVMSRRLAFMTRDHHTVRDFVVREMPRERKPLSPLRIAQTTGLEPQKVAEVLLDLERHLFFIVRDPDGNVSWAFPVTAAHTPHRLTFSTGEKIFGA